MFRSIEWLVSIQCSAGDTGEGDDPTEGEIVKLADDEFVLWVSGRQNCTGMLTHIKVDWTRRESPTLFGA